MADLTGIGAAAQVIHEHSCEHRFTIDGEPPYACPAWLGHMQLAEGVILAAEKARAQQPLPVLPGTTTGRVAELEQAMATLTAELAALRERLDALEAKPPARDAASTTAAVTERRPTNDTWRRRGAADRVFGFGRDGTR